jgi:hypothetical protein
MDKVNGTPGRVQDDPAIVATGEMLFELLAQFGGQLTVDILG